MSLISENSQLILAQQFTPESQIPDVIWWIAGVALVVVVVTFFRGGMRSTTYDLDGEYGGGGGLSRVFRHKKLKKFDREVFLRGRVRTFRDKELDRLLERGDRTGAHRYLVGILNAANEVGDRHTKEKYSEYSRILIEMYDEVEEAERGGKEIHLMK